jgi:hypothetical protein
MYQPAAYSLCYPATYLHHVARIALIFLQRSEPLPKEAETLHSGPLKEVVSRHQKIQLVCKESFLTVRSPD